MTAHCSKKVSQPNQFCAWKGCKTDKPHTDNRLIRDLMNYSPAAIAHQALDGITQLRASMEDDLNGNRSFAVLTRMRQIIELFYRMLFYLLAAKPEEIPHFLSEAQPNNFYSIHQLVNDRLFDGRSMLATHVVKGGALPDERFWDIMHHTAHVSVQALQMARKAPKGFDRALIDTLVQRCIWTLTNIVYALERGDSREEIAGRLLVR
jgi:hypothetical protein